MSREKNIFEKFPKKWPKGVFARRVGGERGNIDLPSGAKGGEKMDLEHHYRHKQHTFNAFCKRTIRNESANAFRQVHIQQDRFVSLSDLSEEGSEALATYDLYPWEYTSFPVDGDVILISTVRPSCRVHQSSTAASPKSSHRSVPVHRQELLPFRN